jgi:uncharacterized membrane protein
MNKRIRFLTFAAVIAALYVVLTAVSALFGLDKGVIQFRISEALTVLPCLTPAAIPGLTIGCLLSGILYNALPLDILLGSLATLIGAFGTYFLGRKIQWLASVPPILSNTVIIPWVLRIAYEAEGAIPFFMLTVGIGEVVCCGILGTLMLYAIPRRIRKELSE